MSVRVFVISLRDGLRPVLPSLALGRTESGADFRFYNTLTGHFISESEAHVVLSGMDRRILVGHPTDWDFASVVEDFVGLANDLQRLNVALVGWGDAVYGDTDDDNDDS